MRLLAKGFMLALMAGTTVYAQGIFFSEYVEGSSNNKALEIYNASLDTVYLADYQIAQSVNGGDWEYWHAFPADAYILSHDVWVIVTTDAVIAGMQAAADESLPYPSVVHHNGDDARALVKIVDTDTTWLDIIGVPDEDPGAGWDVAGVTEATKDHTLVRKPMVYQGNTDWAVSAGTHADTTEWVVHDQDVHFLGSHTANDIALVTFVVDDSTASYSTILLLGSWHKATGRYDAAFGGGASQQMYDDGTNGDTLAGDHVWMRTLELVPDAADGDWQWLFTADGANLLYGNLGFTLPYAAPDTLSYGIAATGVLATVIFQADMTGLFAEGFDEGEGHTLEIRGGFNGWASGDETAPEFLDPTRFTLEKDIFARAGDVFYWKFKANPDSVWNNTGWEVGDNHTFTFTGDDLVLDAVAPNVLAAGLPLTAEATLEYSILWIDGTLNANSGNPFPVAPDTIVVNGDFIPGWDTWGDCMGGGCTAAVAGSEMPRLTDDDGDGIYTGSRVFPVGSGTLFPWKMGAYYPGIDSLIAVSDNGCIDNEAGFGADRIMRLPVTGGTIAVVDTFGSNHPANYDVWELGLDAESGIIPTRFALLGNYPNPFNPETHILFDLDVVADVKVVVYDLTGREINVIHQKRSIPGRYTVTWRGRDRSGRYVPSGVYIYRIKADHRTLTGKMLLLK